MNTKAIKRVYRKARRDVCRTIYYWDSCPNGYRKNRTKQFLNTLSCVALTAAVISIMMALFILCN